MHCDITKETGFMLRAAEQGVQAPQAPGRLSD